MNSRFLFFLVSALLLGTAGSPSAFAQDEHILYRLTKTVYDNGKVVDRSKENITRYYVYKHWGAKPEAGETWMAVSNADGKELFNTTTHSYSSRKKVQSKLGLADDPHVEFYPFVYSSQTNSGILIFLPHWGERGWEIRVAKDKSALNFRYRKNKIKNIYVTDVYEKINDDNSDGFIR